VTPFEWLGWLGNACFFSRFLLQWLHVERVRERAAPRVFWVLSLTGSALLGAYAVHREVWVLLVGFAVNGCIYLRNLAFRDDEHTTLPRGQAAGLAVAVVGQAIWSSRFVVQWWYSERVGSSHFPPAFWVVSLAGNALLLSYAIHLLDPVFIAGLALAPIVQIRNLVLTSRT
jgi:lipid-A-disaccharide synthase-like uncharacterized protein